MQLLLRTMVTQVTQQRRQYAPVTCRGAVSTCACPMATKHSAACLLPTGSSVSAVATGDAANLRLAMVKWTWLGGQRMRRHHHQSMTSRNPHPHCSRNCCTRSTSSR